jgi:hypothetical protein
MERGPHGITIWYGMCGALIHDLTGPVTPPPLTSSAELGGICCSLEMASLVYQVLREVDEIPTKYPRNTKSRQQRVRYPDGTFGHLRHISVSDRSASVRSHGVDPE